MNKLFALAGAAVLFGTGIVGCSNTSEGAAKDANQDAAAVQKAGAVVADKTVEGTKAAGAAVEKGAANAGAAVEKGVATAGATVEKGVANAGAAVEKGVANAGQVAEHTGKVMTVATTVKTAMLKDETLYPTGNAGLNSIDVDLDPDGQTIHLKGKVQTNEMKKKAEEVAKMSVKDAKTPYKFSNELTVEKH